MPDPTYVRRRGWIIALAVLVAGAVVFVWSSLRIDAAGGAPGGAQCDRAGLRVVLDVGHTAEAPGAVSARGATEYEFNLRLAKRIEQQLTEAGFAKTTLLVTGGAARSSLYERIARTNALPADLFVSIHHDSVPKSFREEWEWEGQKNGFSDRFKGHSIFVSYESDHLKRSLAFARLLGQQLKARGLHYTPHYREKFMGRWRRELVDADAGVYRYDQLHVLRTTRMPAVLLEAGSIVNREEEVLLASPEHQALIAGAVAQAVEGFCAARTPRKPNRRVSVQG